MHTEKKKKSFKSLGIQIWDAAWKQIFSRENKVLQTQSRYWQEGGKKRE